MVKIQRPNFSWLPPAVVGFLLFLLLFGPYILIPGNIGWLNQGDPAQHYLGWEFFRRTPWTFPLGLNPRFGLEISNSIVFADGLPLFALPFKLLTAHMQGPFQYYGIWIALCMVLQACFSSSIIGIYTKSIFIKLIGSGIICLFPILLFRLGAHDSLGGQFVILMSLYIYLNKSLNHRSVWWGVALLLSVSIHAYLVVMVGAIWGADLLRRLSVRPRNVERIFLEVCVVLIFAGLVAWQMGYFSAGKGIESNEFGVYRMNVLSLIDPQGWSYLLKNLPRGSGDYEGLAYPGLGALAIMLLGLAMAIRHRYLGLDFIKRNWALLLFFLGLTVIALTNDIGIGSYAFSYEIPGVVYRALSPFRASGRFFWPVLYAMGLGAIIAIAVWVPKRKAVIYLGLAFMVQLLDTSAGWMPRLERFFAHPTSKWETPFKSAFWSDAAKHYKNVRWLLPEAYPSQWAAISYYALKNGLDTDAVYLARVNKEALEQARETDLRALETGAYFTDSLYIADERYFKKAAALARTDIDLVARFDGFNVIAPGWRTLSGVPSYDENQISISQLLPQISEGQKISFGPQSVGSSLLFEGWSSPEDWGVWSEGTTAKIGLRGFPRGASLSLIANAFVSEAHKSQRLTIKLNGRKISELTLTNYMDNRISIDIPPDGEGAVILEFEFPDAVSPAALGLSSDTRALAIGLREMIAHPAGP